MKASCSARAAVSRIFVVASDAFGEHHICLQQRLGSILLRLAGQGTHFGDGSSQGVKLLMERAPHTCLL